MKNIGWIDSHTHMNDEIFYESMEENVSLMKTNEVVLANLISYDIKGLKRAFELQAIYGDLFDHSAGVHPQSIGEMEAKEHQELLTYLDHPEHKEAQKEMFIHQIELANHIKKPIMVHSRDAMQDTYQILEKHRPQYGCIMHCFSGSKEMALKFVDLGFYISLAGVITFKNARVPLEVARAVPLEHLLIETDAPYLTPVPYRGKRNQSAYTKYVGEKLAEIKELENSTVKQQLYQNYQKLTQRI